ncbi:MAG: hypothetical protein KDB00_06000 [Planctomycetales bacterium]|nr:hypothetical protein [Planctomycetales bacterium]
MSVYRVNDRSREIVRQIARRKRELLTAFGQDIREEARRLQTQASGNESSRPGQPAKVHSGEPNLETVLYAISTAADSIVAGPVGRGTVSPIGIPIPALIEHGGRVVIRPRRKIGRRRVIRRRPERARIAIYKPRPTIGPASQFALRQLQRRAHRIGLA